MGFDYKTALLVLGNSGASPIDAIATAYGVPECLLSLGKEVLGAIPSPLLRKITKDLNAGRDSALEALAAFKKKLLLELGFLEIDTESGTFRFISDSSRNKLDDNADKDADNLGGFLQALGGAAAVAGELYANYTEVVSMLVGVQDCLNTYKTFLDLQKGRSSQFLDSAQIEAKYSADIARAREAEAFIAQVDSVNSDITNILIDRLRNPELEPVFNAEFLPSGTTFPSTETVPDEPVPIFRLVFGPPRSKKGQFLLSIDGLYYDSQTGGLPTVSGVIPNDEVYLFNYPANLGGKGDTITSKDLEQYVDTIFDPTQIDDSVELQKHYDADHFLQVLYGQRHRHLYVLSGQITDLFDDGYIEESAMVENSRQQLMAVDFQHLSKINKRKKQIEIAIKAPLMFGATRQFNYGEIPINDFSFLSKLNLSVATTKQRKLVFSQGEVSGVVLPLQPKFVKAAESETIPYFEHLVVPPVGIGSLLFETSGSRSQHVLSLTDSIITDSLIAVYNFLESDVTTTPGSNTYTVLNCAAKSNLDQAAQLVANNSSEVFVSGLSIPFLKGMVAKNSSTGVASGLGSYIQLPPKQYFQNLLYNPNGCTLDFWVHIPSLDSLSVDSYIERGWSASGYHKLVLACENIGGANRNESEDNLQVNYGSEFVRGLVCGFTRDSQIVSDSTASDSVGLNPTNASSMSFYIAPTRSFNTSEVGFLRDTITVDCGTNEYKTLKCSVPLTTLANGASLSMVSSTFNHVVITMEPKENQIKIYWDGALVVTSGLHEVFGSPAFIPPKIPSFVKTGSFGYSLSSTGLSIFTNGPTVSSFTPWIVGGGFTDGLSTGFMAGNNGIHSGLGGFLGSLKFYSRALNISEVQFNYDHQYPYFKNIDV